VVAKLNLVIVTAAAGGLLLLEHAQRVRIDAPAASEIAARNPAICPENESVPFSADCMTFIQSAAGPDLRSRSIVVDGALADSPELP
jgi:hypothetical protein